MSISVEAVSVTKKVTDINPIEAIKKLRSAADALSVQLALHGRLALVEWAEEKIRLGQITLAILFGLTALVCANIFFGVLLLMVGWQTGYMVSAAAALVVFYALCSWIAWRVLRARLAQGGNAFAGTRAELAADVALIRSKL